MAATLRIMDIDAAPDMGNFTASQIKQLQNGGTRLVNWSGMNLTQGGRKFWIGTLDYVSSCTNTTAAQPALPSSRARGFSPSVSDSSAGQKTMCCWPRF